MDHDAFYRPLGGGRFESTVATSGPWSAAMQHGGPVAALLAHELAGHDPVPGLRPGRFAMDLLGPVPVSPLQVRTSTLRPGRRVQLVGAELTAGGRVVARASVWRLAVPSSPPTLLAGAPPPEPPPPLPGEGSWTLEFPGAFTDGYLAAIEGRPVTRQPGAATIWLRPRIPLVAGSEMTALERTLVVADSGNGASAALDPRRFRFLNVDLSVVVHRDPVGEWLCLAARTTIGPTGTGLADTELSDTSGTVGRATQTLLVAPTDT